MVDIAWIEDDHERINSLVRLLEKDGYHIQCYSSWKQVETSLLKILTCDAIILDIILPPIEDNPYMGLSILESLIKEGYSGPIIVCTRVQNLVVLDKMKELGVKTVLRKPIRPTQLYDSVVAALQGG
jgi:FixJ family two-component response regulator